MTTTLPTAADNQLLDALPWHERRALQPDLEWVAMPAGATLHAAGQPLRHVYFPTTAVVSLVSLMQDGASAEVAVVGREGVVGVCAFMGCATAQLSAVVQGAGAGWRMRAPDFAGHARRSEAVMQPLLRYTQALFTHMAQTSACSRHHGLDQQLCRWLLLTLDRCSGTQVTVTQERIAAMLGVRREGVTGGALRLRQAGLIRYGRGRIDIIDRRGLEARSCECYGVVRQAYEHLHGAGTSVAMATAPRARALAAVG